MLFGKALQKRYHAHLWMRSGASALDHFDATHGETVAKSAVFYH